MGKDEKETVVEEQLSLEEARKQQQQIQKNKNREMILTVATGGICLALSYVLSLITIFKMPQGGSVTPASMLPIIFFCLCFGAKSGFVVTFAYSLLQLIGGDFYSPLQVIIDYPLAFTLIGVAGFFAASSKKRLQVRNPIKRLKLVPFWRIGAAVFFAFLLRLACHVISGVVFFSEYARDQNPWVYSILYNGTFLLVEAAITVVILFGISVALGILKVNINISKDKK